MSAISLPWPAQFAIRQVIIGAVLAAVVLAFLGLSRGGEAPAMPTTVAVTEWSIGLDRSSVPAGAVTFTVRNAGRLTHQLAIVKSDRAADALALAHGPAGVPPLDGPSPIEGIVEVAGGVSREATFDLRAGRYVLICLLHGNEQNGMRVALEAAWP